MQHISFLSKSCEIVTKFWYLVAKMQLDFFVNSSPALLISRYVQGPVVRKPINLIQDRLGLSQSPNCTFCNEEPESLEHLLSRCKVSSEFWKQVLSWLKENNIVIESFNKIGLFLEMCMIRCLTILISITKFSLALLSNFNTGVWEYRQKCSPNSSPQVKINSCMYPYQKIMLTLHLPYCWKWVANAET